MRYLSSDVKKSSVMQIEGILSDYEIIIKLQEKFQMTKEQAEEYIMQPV